MSPAEDESGRVAVEAKLLEEADQIVARLEAAQAAAPDDELRAQLEPILQQARRLRSRVREAIARAHKQDHGEQAG